VLRGEEEEAVLRGFFHRLDSYLLIGLVSISVFFCLFKSSLGAFVLGPWVHCNKWPDSNMCT
jgi:hypothetical protein